MNCTTRAISRTGSTIDEARSRYREAPAQLSGNRSTRQNSHSAETGAGHHITCETIIPRLSRFAVEHLLLLPLGALFALVWVNTAPESYYSFTFAISFAVNDVAMMIFFALIAKEIVEATAPGGVRIRGGAPCCP